MFPDCTDVPDCANIGRVECSLSTPEQTCGLCLPGHVGLAGPGNMECIRKYISYCMSMKYHVVYIQLLSKNVTLQKSNTKIANTYVIAQIEYKL